MEFTRYADAERKCIEATGNTPYTGQGIRNYNNGTTLIRSVDDTPFYADKFLSGGVAYTLRGQEGDQSLEDIENKKLREPGRRIFLLEVQTQNRRKKWIWRGEYLYTEMWEELMHPDKNGNVRRIYRVFLKEVKRTDGTEAV
jgi:hypothetical protein